MSDAYPRLREFVDRRMRMSHIYQPVMLQVLLSHGGRAPIRRIAQAFLGHDESQLDYYEQVVKNMPGRVLASHGVVERDGNTYALGPALAGVSEEERVDLIRRCEEAVERFTQKRGSATARSCSLARIRTNTTKAPSRVPRLSHRFSM